MTNLQDPMKGLEGEVSFSKAFIQQISSQMIKLKKENLVYREKIKNMKILITEGIRQNIDLEVLINNKKASPDGRYLKYSVQQMASIKGDKENAYTSPVKLSYNSDPFGTEDRGTVRLAKQGQNPQVAPLNIQGVPEEDEYNSRAEIERLLAVLDRRDQEIDRCKNDFVKRENELNKLKSILNIKEQEIDDLKHLLKSQPSKEVPQPEGMEDVQNLKEKLNLESKKVEQVCKQIIAKDSLIKQLEDKIKELENAPQVSLAEESNIFNSNTHDKDFFESNKTDFLTQDRIKDLEQQIHQLQATIKNLNYKLNTQTAPPEDPELIQKLKDVESENSDLKAKLLAKSVAIEPETETNVESPTDPEEQDKLQKLISYQEVELTEKEAKIQDMEQEIQILRKKGRVEEELSESLENKIANIQAHNLELQDENANLKGELVNFETRNGQQSEIINQLELKNTNLEHHLSEVKSKISRDQANSDMSMTEKDKEIETLREQIHLKELELENKREKFGSVLNQSSSEKTELAVKADNLKDENMLLQAENEALKLQLEGLLSKKEELRALLKEKLQDASKFKKQIQDLEDEFLKKLEDKCEVFKEYHSGMKTKLMKKLTSVLKAVKQLRLELELVQKANTEKCSEILSEINPDTLNERVRSIIKTLKDNLSSLELGPKVMIDEDPESKDQQIIDLTEMLIQQKNLNDQLKNEGNRNLERQYASDLSVTTQERNDIDQEMLDLDLQEKRRERDRLAHENFGLQSDVEGLEADKERVLEEIDENEEHLDELKSKLILLFNYNPNFQSAFMTQRCTTKA